MGTIAGAAIKVKPGALLILVFFAFMTVPIFQGGYFSPSKVVAGAIMVAVLILASVFLHEVSHLLAGRAFGVQAKEIALTLMGGHATFPHPFRKPWHGAIVALCGPLINIVLAGLFQMGTTLVSSGSALHAGFSILVTMNLALAVFNLVPGLPLDGGAALRDTLWSITGSKLKATNFVGTLGQFLAVVIVLTAIAIPMARGALPNYTLLLFAALVAGFLWVGGRQAKRIQKEFEWLKSRTVYEYLTRAFAISESATVGDLDQLVRAHPGVTGVIFSSANEPIAYPVPQAVATVPAHVRGVTPIGAVSARLITGSVIQVDTPILSVFRTAQHLGASLPFFVVLDGTSLVGIMDAQKSSSDPN